MERMLGTVKCIEILTKVQYIKEDERIYNIFPSGAHKKLVGPSKIKNLHLCYS